MNFFTRIFHIFFCILFISGCSSDFNLNEQTVVDALNYTNFFLVNGKKDGDQIIFDGEEFDMYTVSDLKKNDLWGNRFLYFPDESYGFSIVSCGPDGFFDHFSNDDIWVHVYISDGKIFYGWEGFEKKINMPKATLDWYTSEKAKESG